MSKIICIIIELEKRDDSMKEDLDTEKRAMERAWAKREKQIQKVVENMAGMYGNL